MSIFDGFAPTEATRTNTVSNMGDALRQMQANPAGMLQQAGFNVPAGLHDPQQIVTHLLQSGQVGNARLQQVMQMARGFR